MNRDIDIAWAAGLFEGEGCFTCHTNVKSIYLRVGVTSTDLDVLERFADVVGCGSIYPLKQPAANPYGKQAYRWETSGDKNFLAVANLLWDHLGQRRQERVQELLSKRRPQDERLFAA